MSLRCTPPARGARRWTSAMPGPSWTRARPGPIGRPIGSRTGAATCGPNSPCAMSSSPSARAVPPSPRRSCGATGAIVPEFLVYHLLSPVGRGQIERDARGSSGTMPKISQGHIKSWRILLPPSEEQQCIVKSIDAATAPVDSAISRLEREIDLLREYRTRLVADVVTGKLDVREAAARLPVEEPEEPM